MPYYTANQKKLDRLTQITNENLEGARVVRAFRSRDRERARFDAAAEDMLQNSLHIGHISAWLNPLTFAIVNFGVALILLWSGFKVDTGVLSSGEIVALINYMVQILNAMIVISNLVSLFTKAHASMNRVSEVFALTPSVTDGAGAQPIFRRLRSSLKTSAFRTRAPTVTACARSARAFPAAPWSASSAERAAANPPLRG